MLFQYGNKETSSTQSYGPQIDNLIGRGYEGLGKSGLTDRIGGYQSSVEPMNDSQRWGIALAQDAGHLAGRDFSGGILGAGGGYNPTQITGDSIQGMMNPFLQTVGRSTLNEMGRARDDAHAAIGARNANAVAFGGSGAALERAQLDRSHGENVANTISGLMAGGFDRASQLAAQNAAIENAGGQFNSQLGLNANIAADAAYGNMMGRRGDVINGLLTTGAIGQAQGQAERDLGWTDWQKFMSSLPTAGATTTNNNPQYFDPLAMAVGIGTKFLGF